GRKSRQVRWRPNPDLVVRRSAPDIHGGRRYRKPDEHVRLSLRTVIAVIHPADRVDELVHRNEELHAGARLSPATPPRLEPVDHGRTRNENKGFHHLWSLLAELQLERLGEPMNFRAAEGVGEVRGQGPSACGTACSLKTDI